MIMPAEGDIVEHCTLINELQNLESLSPHARLNHAKQRRLQQISNYNERNDFQGCYYMTKASHSKNIHFAENITLLDAAARNDAQEVQQLVNKGVDPNLQNEDGLSALHQAVIEGCCEVVDVLIKCGANLNIKDADNWTPMHAAVACGNLDLVQVLSENSASLIEINTDGNMPIDLVEDNEEIEMYLDKLLSLRGYTESDLEKIRNQIQDEMLDDLCDSVAKGRSLDITGEHGESAMHVAAANGYVEVIEYLLDHGAKVNVVDNDFWQPIHAAACWGQDKIIEILANHGSDLDAETADGETPSDLTEDEELQGMILELKESGKQTKELKRTQSNSSRTLSVRRSSAVDKHRISVNDAKQEGIFRQNPEFLKVAINTDEADNANCESDITRMPMKFNSEIVCTDTVEEEKKNTAINIDRYILKDELKKFNSEESCALQDYSNHLPSMDVKPVNFNADNAIEAFNNKSHETILLSSKESSPEGRKQSFENDGYIMSNIDWEKDDGICSHNTAIKKKSKGLSESSEIAMKKKCCIIV